MSQIKPVSVNCGACDRELIQVIVNDKVEIDWNIVAHCPFCGDKSYKKKFVGLLSIANGKNTEIDHDDTIDDITHFYLAIRN